MTLLVVLLVAGAAIVHATWNVVIKRAGTSGVGFIWASFAVGAVVFAPFGIWSLIDSGAHIGHWLGFAAVSGALQVAYFLLLQRGYAVGDVSVVYPLARGTGPLLSVVLAVVLLGERPGPITVLGAVVVVTGVMTIGFAGGRAGAANNRAGVVFGLVIGVLIAGYTLWDATAVTLGELPAVGLYWGSVVFQTLLLAPAALMSTTGRAQIVAAPRVPAATVGVLAPLGYILVLLAVQLAPVSVIAPAREVSVVLVGLAGWLFFREPHPVQRLIGAAVVLLGVGLLATAQ